MPQRAQHILTFALDNCANADSCRKLAEDMGSIVSCPVLMAVSTDRRDNQLSEGAKSSRTVGSLKIIH